MKTDALTGPNQITQGIIQNARKFADESAQVKVNLPELEQVKVEISEGNKGKKIDATA